MSEILDPVTVDGDREEWTVREASPADAASVADAVGALLVELGGTPPESEPMSATARALIEDASAGTVLLAETAGGLVGVLAASWPTAIHSAGAYGLIQDLWVSRAWRGRSVGASLVESLGAIARARGVDRIEVGLPREGFHGLEATARFYRQNGFEPLGPRMRLRVASERNEGTSS